MENKCYLAVETKNKNYFPINLLDLNISNNFNTYKLDELDAFTIKFTKEEIMNSIKEANLLEVNNTMPLIVIYNEKNVVRKVLSLTKDISFDMWSFIKDNFHDKVFLNKIYNYLNNLIDEESMKRLKGAKNIEDFMKLLNTFSYVTLRKLYFYLYEK